uniref:RING-type domain-containing protein n=1 Tax=Neogobius melanostomus TaxID=47308 RepID=A0A8C6WM12_9GOBI
SWWIISDDVLKDFLTCPVCLDTFKEPVSLGCNHSFCSSCLQNYWDTTTPRTTCPVCRRKSSKEHPSVNLPLKQLSLSFKAEEGVCSKHPSVPAQFCLDEARALCGACEVSQHRDHTVVSVEEAVSRLKEQLQSELKPLTEQREQASALQRQYEEVRVHSERQAEACARHIRETFERLHRFLQEEEELRLTALREERSVCIYGVFSICMCCHGMGRGWLGAGVGGWFGGLGWGSRGLGWCRSWSEGGWGDLLVSVFTDTCFCCFYENTVKMYVYS